MTHKAEALDLAVDGAAEKMRHALEHLTGKLDAKVTSTGHIDDPINLEDSQEFTDSLLQDDFLAKQAALGKE